MGFIKSSLFDSVPLLAIRSVSLPRIVARLAFLVLVAISRGAAVAIEQPRGSLMPRCPFFVRMAYKLRRYYDISWQRTNLSGSLIP